jgi:hypothetical protein
MTKLTKRRIVRDLARAGAVVSAAMCVVIVGSSHDSSAAGVNAGALQVVVPPGSANEGQPITAGGSATAFALAPPAGASCKGDSATGGYRVQSYIVPASVDPGTLTFDSGGPIPPGTGANLRLPLFSSVGGSPFVDQTTAVATTPGSGGLLTGLPPFSFAAFGADGPNFVPVGTYNLGFACTLGGASATQQDRFWNVRMTFAVDPTDQPSGITWTLAAAAPPPPSSTSSTIAATTPPSSSSTTIAATGASVSSSSSSTPAAQSVASSSVALQSLAATRAGSGSSGLVSTGSSPLPIAVWAILLLAFGRIAILFGRRLRVAPPKKQ